MIRTPGYREPGVLFVSSCNRENPPLIHTLADLRLRARPRWALTNGALILCLSLSTGVTAQSVETPQGESSDRNLSESFLTRVEQSENLKPSELAALFVAAGGRDGSSYRREIENFAREFRDWLGKLGEEPESPEARMLAIQRFVFKERSFVADLDLRDPENLFPDSILKRRRGFCLGMSLLLADLGERVGWPLEIASAPRHTFVRYSSESDNFNLETTQAGRLRRDEWYIRRYAPAVREDGRELLRSLSAREIAGHLVNNYGYVLLETGELAAAQREFQRALSLYPGLVEAQINAGVLAARRQQFAAALRQFELALKRWPGDTGLRLNRTQALLKLGRLDDAIEELISLNRLGADSPELDRATRAAEALLYPTLTEAGSWKLKQQLVDGRLARRARVQGTQSGIRGTYYARPDLTEEKFTRIDPDVSFQWKWNSPDRSRLPRDHFSVRWQGLLRVPEADDYTFYITCSDGVRVWIDDRAVINAWRRANDNFSRGSIPLRAGLHEIVVEYYETVGEAGITTFVTAEKKTKTLNLSKLLIVLKQ